MTTLNRCCIVPSSSMAPCTTLGQIPQFQALWEPSIQDMHGASHAHPVGHVTRPWTSMNAQYCIVQLCFCNCSRYAIPRPKKAKSFCPVHHLSHSTIAKGEKKKETRTRKKETRNLDVLPVGKYPLQPLAAILSSPCHVEKLYIGFP
jgi:hypothetical protein